MSEKINYQWIKGDHIGNVEAFLKEEDDGGMMWTYFESGRRINSSVLQEFLIPLSPGEVPMDMEVSKEIPSPIATVSKPAKASKVSPIRSLLEKQKKSKREEVSVRIELEIPTKELFSILEENFGREEMLQEIESAIMEKISIDNLAEKTKEEVQKFINKYYDTNA